MPVDHYENFPVASWLLPAKLREPVAAIYHFARYADDLADEGNFSTEERLTSLEHCEAALDEIAQGHTPKDFPFTKLAPVIRDYKLDIALFRALISAFKQDLTKTRYADFDELLDYCSRSANPVGRLMLCLYRADTEENRRMSDKICTSLQLINFWQDVAIDLKKDRIYIPLKDMQAHQITEAQLASKHASPAWAALMRSQCEMTRTMMMAGAPLGRKLPGPGRIGLELRTIVAGGLRILDKIEQIQYDTLHKRPVLTARDWFIILYKAVARA